MGLSKDRRIDCRSLGFGSFSAAATLACPSDVRASRVVTFSISRCEMPRNVSNTPLPWVATASKNGTRSSGIQPAFSSSTV